MNRKPTIGKIILGLMYLVLLLFYLRYKEQTEPRLRSKALKLLQ